LIQTGKTLSHPLGTFSRQGRKLEGAQAIYVRLSGAGLF
jgi:hypothetical protein